MDLSLFAGAYCMGEVHLPARHDKFRGSQDAAAQRTNSAEAVWRHFCAHGRFPMHGCARLEAHAFGKEEL